MICVSLPINRLYFNLLLVCVSLHVATSTAFKSSKLYIFVGIIGGSIFMPHRSQLHDFRISFLKELHSGMTYVCWMVRELRAQL